MGKRSKRSRLRSHVARSIVVVAGVLAAMLAVVAQGPAHTGRGRSSIPPPRRLPQQSWPLLSVQSGARRFVSVTFDGHVHTARSHDAVHPPRDVVELAERVDLDALMVTDHGTSSAAFELAGYTGPSTPIMGSEIGGRYGHALTWSFMDPPASQQDSFDELESLAARVHHDGGLVVLAHPGWFIPGNFVNPRYFMQYDAIRRGGHGAHLDAIEIWNATYPMRTESLVDEWMGLLDRQVYVPITCGTDFHRLGQVMLGSPRNVALCPADGTATTEAGKRACILEAVRAGRVYLTEGPSVDLQVAGRVLGEIVEAQRGESLVITVRAIAFRPATLRVRIGHVDVRSFELTPGVERSERIELRASEDTYVLAEVARAQREPSKPRIALITNPIRVDVAPRVEDWRGPEVVAPRRIPREWTRAGAR